MHEFIDHGSRGLRIDQVTARSGLNKRMIYHHFQSRSGLIAAVVRVALSSVSRTDLHADALVWVEAKVSAHFDIEGEQVDSPQDPQADFPSAPPEVDQQALLRALLAEILLADNRSDGPTPLPRRIAGMLAVACYTQPESPRLRASSTSRPVRTGT